jgi:hypothetical protein
VTIRIALLLVGTTGCQALFPLDSPATDAPGPADGPVAGVPSVTVAVVPDPPFAQSNNQIRLAFEGSGCAGDLQGRGRGGDPRVIQ